jgi:enoyl-CoA hydratase/carnithine racemase
MADVVTYSSEDRIATVTINRPDSLNALNEDVIQGLKSAWERLESSDDRVAILHAAGDRAFSVGADIKNPPAEMWEGVPSVGVAVSKPIIAALHGWCIGGAYVIVQMCDLVVASETTVFKYPEAQLGFTGGLIASAVARIPRSPWSSCCSDRICPQPGPTRSEWSTAWFPLVRNSPRPWSTPAFYGTPRL